MNFYDLNEWELYDLEKDPHEMKNQIDNPEYADVVKDMRVELEKLRAQYKVPENQAKDISNPDSNYHSATMRQKALAGKDVVPSSH